MIAVDAATSRRVLEGMPHRPPMRLIETVIEACATAIVCQTQLRPDTIVVRDGRLSPLVAIELFAQAAAALMVWRAREGGAPIVSGMLLGTRRITLDGAPRVGEILTIRVEERWHTGPLAQFHGVLSRDDETIASGAINVAAGGPPA